MAKVHKNLFVQGFSGSLGDFVIRHMADGSTRVSMKPDFSKRKFSQGQKDHQSRFQQAVAYAREAAKTQPIYAELARGTTKNAYNWALSDWFNPPVIHSIRRTGAAIGVEASDDVLVAKVRLQILDETGQVLEEGEASRADPELRPEWWEYRPNSEGRTIIAEAWDLAGNRSESLA